MIQFTYHKLYPFEMYSSVDFSKFSSFRIFLSLPPKETGAF